MACIKPGYGIFYLLAFCGIVWFFASGAVSCGFIQPPSGGPKDTIPPVLVSAVPKMLATHFTGNKIVFTFDEYVNVDRIQDNLIVSPSPRINPLVQSKLKTVTVKLKDTLLANTTYQLNFGKAIRDVDEANILKNFTYVFSTGSFVDSLQFSGRVLIAKNGKVDSTLIVILHTRLDDSAVVKDRPRYVTTLDTLGNFNFRFLAPGTYALYALKDPGGSRKYFSKSQLFAFADKPVIVTRETPPVTLYAYEEETEKKNQSSKPGVTKQSSKSEKDKEKRLQLRTNIVQGRLDILGNLILQFATALKNFDSAKLLFTDEQFHPITNYRLITGKDSTRRTIELVYKWVPDTKYNLIAQKDFAQDSAGRHLLKTDTIAFATKRESDYGEFSIRFINLDLKKNPVLELIQGDEIKYSFPLTSRQFSRTLFEPGEYKVSVLYDDNKNGVWDPGEFFGVHRQPERVQQVYINNKKHVLTVKTSWDNDFDITL